MNYRLRLLAIGCLTFVVACQPAPRATEAPGKPPVAPIASPTAAEAAPTLDAPTIAPTPEPATAEPALDTATQAAATQTAGREDEYAAARERLVEEGIAGQGITDTLVIEAMRAVPRHEFVPSKYLAEAYDNYPLPIGHGQTISQPYVVALMTQAAQVQPGDRVLEVGTGSGYQAAVLAELVDHVVSVEIIRALTDGARERLRRLGYTNVAVEHADGYFGWKDAAPFDAILVTAAPDHIPQPLVQQLKVGGRMVIPVGPVGGYQTLWLVTRVSADDVRTQDLGGVSFVPLTREPRD